MSLRLQLFGTPTFALDAGADVLPFERRSQLVALLALRRDWVGRAEVAALLWPDQSPARALGNLRKTLFRLQSLPWGAPLESQGSSLRLSVDTDVQAFEQALCEQQPAAALALYRGPLLAGFDDDGNELWTGWLHFERERLRNAWRGAALERLASAVDEVEGISLSARLLEADPLDEAALGVHLTLLARVGQTTRAQQRYKVFVERLADELGIAPGPHLLALRDSLGRAAAVASPVAAAVSGGVVDDASFVGRAVERRRIADWLAQHGVRLLTLTGPGGIGKTRLARYVLNEQAAAFADGAVFVPLEDVTEAGGLVLRVARETGAVLRGHDAPLAQLSQALAERQTLLVLDNFEQLAGQAAALQALQALLDAGPRVKLLVTSRVRLGLASEQLLALEGMPCPEQEDLDHIDAFDAVRLFVAAARRVEPALVPAAEAAAIVDICRQVDGLPLALELAAAWTRMLSCEAIADELRQGVELLRAADASHPPRHASIELVFEQSWRHLVASEREALTRLSVFHGGFQADAARAVAGVSLPVLGALADKSLLRKEGTRLSLHPLVQQLAALRLAPEAQQQAQAAHADYFHRRLAQLAPAIGVGDRRALLAVDVDLENHRLAWSWSIAQGQAEVVARSAMTLQRHFDHRGRFEAGLALLRQALDAPSLQGHAHLRARLLAEAAQFEYRLDRYAEAAALASTARTLLVAGRGGDRTLRVRALNVLASCALRLGRLADARRHFRQVLAVAMAEGRALTIANTLDHLALVEKRSGSYDEALRLSLEALPHYRRQGDDAGAAVCLSNLGSLYLARHDPHAASAPLREALAICERNGLPGTEGLVLSNLIEVEMATGELDAAERHAERALAIADAAGNRLLGASVRLAAARMAARRGALDLARARLAAGVETAQQLALPSLRAGAMLAFAELLHVQGEGPLACRVLRFAVRQPDLGAVDRDAMQAVLATWRAMAPDAGADDDVAELAIGQDELLHRIVAERELAHRPLRSWLGARVGRIGAAVPSPAH
jgi:predicted ATPase/DNA-binding SARP family transcriptional activator